MGKIVGVLSMQKVINYGSFLQAYAMKQLLLLNGADKVYFIDIKPGRPLPGFEWPHSISKPKKLKNICTYICNGSLFSKIKDVIFEKRLKKNIVKNFDILGLDKEDSGYYDSVVIGSDEVFNCCQKTPWQYTLQLYGEISNVKNIISYAGSFGHTTYSQLLELGIDKEIGATMRKMNSVSVRDQNSYDIVRLITGVKPEIHLDPVLIYGFKNEINKKVFNVDYDYMIVYSYMGRINNQEEINQIISFANSHNLRLISIFCRYDWCYKAIIPHTPLDIFPWFKEAKYVITDTFHGSVFSIITNRLFCTLIRDNNKQKIEYLLSKFHLTDRIIYNIEKDNIFDVLEKNIDYNFVNEVLLKERKMSFDYLQKKI